MRRFSSTLNPGKMPRPSGARKMPCCDLHGRTASRDVLATEVGWCPGLQEAGQRWPYRSLISPAPFGPSMSETEPACNSMVRSRTDPDWPIASGEVNRRRAPVRSWSLPFRGRRSSRVLAITIPLPQFATVAYGASDTSHQTTGSSSSPSTGSLPERSTTSSRGQLTAASGSDAVVR